jgi:hypothetical protein
MNEFITIKLFYCCPSLWRQNASACDCDYVIMSHFIIEFYASYKLKGK